MDFAEFLKNFRKEKGWSQERMARQVGLSTIWVRKLESRSIGKPSDNTLLDIAPKLGIPTDVLLRIPASQPPAKVKRITIPSDLWPALVDSAGKQKQTVTEYVVALLRESQRPVSRAAHILTTERPAGASHPPSPAKDAKAKRPGSRKQ